MFFILFYRPFRTWVAAQVMGCFIASVVGLVFPVNGQILTAPPMVFMNRDAAERVGCDDRQWTLVVKFGRTSII